MENANKGRIRVSLAARNSVRAKTLQSNNLKHEIYMRRLRDSNPRYPFEVYTLSRRAPSTTRTSLQIRAAKIRLKSIGKAVFLSEIVSTISAITTRRCRY